MVYNSLARNLALPYYKISNGFAHFKTTHNYNKQFRFSNPSMYTYFILINKQNFVYLKISVSCPLKSRLRLQLS